MPNGYEMISFLEVRHRDAVQTYYLEKNVEQSFMQGKIAIDGKIRMYPVLNIDRDLDKFTNGGSFTFQIHSLYWLAKKHEEQQERFAANQYVAILEKILIINLERESDNSNKGINEAQKTALKKTMFEWDSAMYEHRKWLVPPLEIARLYELLLPKNFDAVRKREVGL